jgi:uncharacterized protein YcfL
MKKILIALSLFLVFGCASTETTKTNNTSDPKNPIEAISRALEKIALPKF